MFEIEPARRDELVETWSAHIVQRGLGPAAIFMLEAHKPLSNLGAHSLVAFQPLLTPLTKIDVNELAAFIRETENVELLLRRIEDRLDDKRDAEADRKARRKKARRRARHIARLRRKRSKA